MSFLQVAATRSRSIVADGRPLACRLGVAVLTLLGLFAGIMMLSVQPAHAATTSRAMWVWSKADPAAVVSFAQDQGVSTLFVAVGADVATSGDLPRLQQMATLANGAGIRLDALGGDPSWTTNHTAAVAWERAAARTGLFSGFHVDVEPYALSGWSKPSSRSRLVTSYLGLLATLQQNAHTTGRMLEADVPFWYGTIPADGNTLADGVLARVDAVTVMSYRDQATGPNSITDVGADMLARGVAADRPVRLAAETNPLSDCPTCTFSGHSGSDLQDALARVDLAESAAPAYAGLAVEDYDGWQALPA